MADTYYVYDALGNLCFVLPPALKSMRVGANMVWNIHECALLRQYAYFYRYDNRGLLDDGSYSTIDYCSNLTYENKKLSTILFDGGYASVDADGNIAMHYYVKDHLGSNRLVVDGNGNIEETNHYYPFGALMGDSKNVKRNKYKYVGKGLDRMYGIDIAQNPMMVEVSSAKTITYLNTNGQVASEPFMIPYDYTDSFNRNLSQKLHKLFF